MNPYLRIVSERALTAQELDVVRCGRALDLGRLHLSAEGDLLRMHSDSGLIPDDYVLILALCRELRVLHGSYALLAVSGPKTQPMGLEQRRMITAWMQHSPGRGMALVSPGSTLVRAMTSLLLKAINALSPRSTPFSLFGSEAEARDWLSRLPPPASSSAPRAR